MPWEVIAYQDEGSLLDDQISEILSEDVSQVPPFDQNVGHVEVHWDDVGGRRAFLQARGGTVDDRNLARLVTEAQLASCGFRLASRDWGMEKTANWADIMTKAKRLMQTGAVQILRNGYNNIVAQVQGDHGSYQAEIFRQDPNSRAITGSDCECGWGEFQNQPRTRQWKRFQDRPCSHILAAFWQSQSLPLDEDANPQNPANGGGPSPAPGPQTFGPSADLGFDPAQRSFTPDMSGGGSQVPPAPGGPPGGGDEPPGPSPADLLPQYPMAQMPQPPAQNPVSIPGGNPPTPMNPIQYPAGPGGTFSSVKSVESSLVIEMPDGRRFRSK